LVKIMKDNPTIKVELGSHTDTRGSDSYNVKLSQRRADSAVKYIISKGIDRSKITAKGYGESKLINKCKNGVKCTEAEHQENRRTEFTVTGFTDAPTIKSIK
ncbi:MAG: OmpA family protein, partial [Ignavibacteria bacterium]|nr:OmpA family protein [Ignavibacteria bacterium]